MFTYISQGEPDDFGFLPAGVYEGKITKMEEGQSKTGNPMLTVYIRAFGANGSATVRYYLPASDKTIWKIDLFVKNVTGKTYQDGEQVIINPADYIGRSCYVRLGIEQGTQMKSDGTYPQFNKCEDVIEPEVAKNILALAGERPKRSADLPTNNHLPASAGVNHDDEIPF